MRELYTSRVEGVQDRIEDGVAVSLVTVFRKAAELRPFTTDRLSESASKDLRDIRKAIYIRHFC
jgi:hypothetical protein